MAGITKYTDESWKKTNADKIRAMTDEELAKGMHAFMCRWCPKPTSECIGKCEECLIDWLRQEAE